MAAHLRTGPFLRHTVLAWAIASAAVLSGLAALPVSSGASSVARAQSGAPPAFTPRDEDPSEYPAGPGRDDTFYACTACHGFGLVAQQGMTREQWDESLTWMTQRHKMPEITGKDREAILDYLAAHYAPKAHSGAGGWKNPFAPQ